MGGTARENGMKGLAIGGTADHVHILLSLPATLSVAKAIQLIKGGSSKWVHDRLPKYRKFEWQDGYGAFSVSASQMKSVVTYINRQKEPHRKKTFEEEFLEFLDHYGLEYDRQYVFR
jgi:REP element-mobilizing transposase RayT